MECYVLKIFENQAQLMRIELHIRTIYFLSFVDK